jgi:hypothetical protein
VTGEEFDAAAREILRPPYHRRAELTSLDGQVAALRGLADDYAAHRIEEACSPPAAREPVSPEAIAAVIKGQSYRYSDETALQEGIAGALAQAGIPATREVHLTAADKIDFMAGPVGIEVKVAGQPAAVTRQLRRYATSDDVAELMLVTTRAAHRSVPRELAGKTVHVVWLSGVTR